MNTFVHSVLRHFPSEEADGDGSDLGGSEALLEEEQEEEPEDDGVTVTLGDEPASEEVEQEAQAPAWVKELRKNHRELQKQNRDLEAKLKATSLPEVRATVLGPKPKLEDCEYDTEKYDTALGSWYDQKRKVEEEASKAQAEQQTQQQAWQQTLNAYGDAKAKLKVRDYDDAESTVDGILSETQRGIILHITANPAQMIYALGKNPAKARELASITDPVKYAGAIGALETKLKVTPRKAPPPESGNVRGSGSISGSVDSTLDRLRAEAEKTGDLSKVVAYKRSKKQST